MGGGGGEGRGEGKISLPGQIYSDFLVFWHGCKLLNFNIHSDQKLANSKYRG